LSENRLFPEIAERYGVIIVVVYGFYLHIAWSYGIWIIICMALEYLHRIHVLQHLVIIIDPPDGIDSLGSPARMPGSLRGRSHWAAVDFPFYFVSSLQCRELLTLSLH